MIGAEKKIWDLLEKNILKMPGKKTIYLCTYMLGNYLSKIPFLFCCSMWLEANSVVREFADNSSSGFLKWAVYIMGQSFLSVS